MSNSTDLIQTQTEIDKVKSKFDELNNEIDKKIYTSVIEERTRTNKIVISSKIKKPITDVWNEFIKMILTDLKTDVNINDLKKDIYFTATSSKITFQVLDFQLNERISLLWFANKQRFIRTIVFSSYHKNQYTKINYIDLVKGNISVVNYLERKMVTNYSKKQVIAFQIQMLKLKLNLNILSERKVFGANLKIKKLQKSFDRIK